MNFNQSLAVCASWGMEPASFETAEEFSAVISIVDSLDQNMWSAFDNPGMHDCNETAECADELMWHGTSTPIGSVALCFAYVDGGLNFGFRQILQCCLGEPTGYATNEDDTGGVICMCGTTTFGQYGSCLELY